MRTVSVEVFVCSFVQQLLAAHTSFKNSLNEAEREFHNIASVDAEASRVAKDGNITVVQRNPYISLTLQV